MRTGFVLLLLLAACSEPVAGLVASDVKISAPLPGQSMAGGYLTLTNNTDADIEISAVSSDAFESVSIHNTVIEDGVSRMRPVETLHVAAHSSTQLKTGGLHLMLSNPTKESLNSTTLKFLLGDALLLEVTVPIQHRARD